MRDAALARRLAWRELRGGLSGFRIFVICLFLGVVTIAAVGSLSAALVDGLAQRGQEILGGDVDIRLIHREASAEEQAFFAAQGTLSQVSTMRVMVRRPDGDKALLAEAKAIDDLYPLVGALELDPPRQSFTSSDLKDAVFVANDFLDQMGLQLGDRILIGDAALTIRALIKREPDRLSGGFAYGPRVMMSHETLRATGLYQPGSLINNHYRLVLNDQQTQNIDRLRLDLDENFPNAGWRMRDRRDASPSVRRSIERIGLFLTLVGLTALTAGGVGVGNAISAYLLKRQHSITILKCLGARQGLIGKIYISQIIAIATLAIGLALIVGAIIPQFVIGYVSDFLDIPMEAGVDIGALMVAVGFGFATAIGFTMAPLGRAAQTTPAKLFRDMVEEVSTSIPFTYRAIIGFCAGLVIALCFLIAERADIATYFILGIGLSFFVLRLTAMVLKLLARLWVPYFGFTGRMALRNIYRPGSPVNSVVLSVGLSVALVTTLAMVEGNFASQLRQDFPERAPSFFAIDIQPDQKEAFESFAQSIDGFVDMQMAPMLRGSVLAVNGVDVDQVTPVPDIAWFLRGDRGITYSAAPPENNEIVTGNWWPLDYDGPPIVSMDQRIANGLGLSLGDTITINVLGRPLKAEITSFRNVDYGSGQINFALIFSPLPLKNAPHTLLGSISMAAAGEAAFSSGAVSGFPNITTVRVKDAIEAVGQLLNQFGQAIWALSTVTIIASLLVLAGALASSRQGRIYDAAILRSLGARRGRIIGVFLSEYAFTGFVAALISGLIGVLASYALIAGAMRSTWVFLPQVMAISVLGAFAVTMFLAAVSFWVQLGGTTLTILRRE
jgi:putative ABC transport system permease protein